MKKIKILYTIPNFDTAGSGKALLNIALGLDKTIFEPHILCLHDKGDFFKVVKKSGVPVSVFDYIPKERPILKMLKNCWQVSRKIKEINPDIVHSFHYSANYTEALSAKLSGAKWVFTKKNMSWGGSSKNSWKIRSFLADKIAVQNTDMKTQFYPNSNKISLIPRGVTVQNFKSSEPKAEIFRLMNTNLDKRIVICVANLVPVKGIELLIDAFSNIQLDNKNWNLWIVGDYNNDYGKQLLDIVKNKNLSETIKFSGKQNNVKNFLDCAEIFVLPTKDEGRREGSPVALLEAMSNGKVVIGSKVPGIKDQLSSFSNHLFEAGNSSDLKEKMANFMKNSKDKNQEIGKIFEDFANKNFTIEQEIKKHEQLYLSLK